MRSLQQGGFSDASFSFDDKTKLERKNIEDQTLISRPGVTLDDVPGNMAYGVPSYPVFVDLKVFLTSREDSA